MKGGGDEIFCWLYLLSMITMPTCQLTSPIHNNASRFLWNHFSKWYNLLSIQFLRGFIGHLQTIDFLVKLIRFCVLKDLYINNIFSMFSFVFNFGWEHFDKVVFKCKLRVQANGTLITKKTSKFFLSFAFSFTFSLKK